MPILLAIKVVGVLFLFFQYIIIFAMIIAEGVNDTEVSPPWKSRKEFIRWLIPFYAVWLVVALFAKGISKIWRSK